MEKQTQTSERHTDTAAVREADRFNPLFLAGLLLISAIPLAACVIIILGFVQGWPPANPLRVLIGAAMILIGAYAGAVSAASQFLTLQWRWVVPALLVVAVGFFVVLNGFVV
jgi:hypothetical protein